MQNFGLDYARLQEINPDLIMVSMPGVGMTGPSRDFAAFAWTTEQMSTITHLTGYAGGDPLFTGTTCGDPLAGLMGALAMFAAVNHRRRTGEGQHIDLSQVEASTTFVGEYLVEAQVTGVDPTRRGNANAWMAPHGTYPGTDDRWIAIACADDAMWQALWTAIGSPSPEPDGTAPFATLDQRHAAAAQIDEWLTTFTAQHDPRRLMHVLQDQGVAAGAVLDGRDLLEEPHLRDRAFFVELDRDEIGMKHHLEEPFRLRDTPSRAHRRTAYLGEHNRDILCGELGVSDDEYDKLEVDDVIGTWPAGIPRPA
jgi:crotonobetainyl-CoA:carnitine CoA-transferase CaiB-like acyl-CoA transferase